MHAQSFTHTHSSVNADSRSGNSHKKVRTKSAEQTKCREERVEPWVGGLIESER